MDPAYLDIGYIAFILFSIAILIAIFAPNDLCAPSEDDVP